MFASKSIFSLAGYPSNLLDAAEWRKFARATRRNSIRAAMRYYAAQKGGALYLRADDSLVVLTRRDGGKIEQRTFKPGSWAFA